MSTAVRARVRRHLRHTQATPRARLRAPRIRLVVPPVIEDMRTPTTPADTITPAWTQWKEHPDQVALWTCPSRFVHVVAGRGSGKTEMARRRLVRMLPVRKPWGDPKYFYGAPTLPQAKRIAWTQLLRLIPKSWVADVNRTELVITTVFGSELWVVGLDKPQRVEGVQWDGCVIDESSDIKPGTFHLSILPALTWRSGWCWRIGVPKRYGVGATEFRHAFEAALRGELADAASFSWPSEDIVPDDALRTARAHMDAKDYEEQFRARWVSAAGGIFYAFNEEVNVRPVAYNPNRPIIIGSDFNVDPMAWVLCHRFGQGTPDDHLEVFDELWMRDAHTRMALNQVHGKYHHHKAGFAFFGDATGKARKTSAAKSDYLIIKGDQRFFDLGRSIHYLHSNPPKADRFAACNALICAADDSRRLYVDPRCKHLISDLNSRTYKPGTRDPADVGDQGHITDALGYVIYKMYPIRVAIEGSTEVIVTTGV